VPRRYEANEKRREQVAKAALQTLVEVGVAGFTTKAIASRVGITDGTMFRHFGTKQDIVLAAMDRLGVEIEASLVSQVSALVDLEAFFRHRAAFVGGEASVGRLIFSDGLAHLAGEAGRERIREWRRTTLAYVRPRLMELHQQGQLQPHLDPASAAVVVQGILLTFAMGATLGSPHAEPLPERIDRTWQWLRLVLFIQTPPGAPCGS
jgi:AcrR family transcriptional regulator